MTDRDPRAERLLDDLKERAKELDCLYRVDEILGGDGEQYEVFNALIDTLPQGWKHPEVCQARIIVEEQIYQPAAFVDTPWSMRAEIDVEGDLVGEISVSYIEARPAADEGPFLREEWRLLRAIAERVGHYLTQQRTWERRAKLVDRLSSSNTRSWHVLVEFLQQTDQELLKRITRKMINLLYWSGVEEAAALLRAEIGEPGDDAFEAGDDNRPLGRRPLHAPPELVERTFELADRHLDGSEIVSHMQAWISEDNCGFLIQALEDQSTTTNQIAEHVLRFATQAGDRTQLSAALHMSLKVGLLRTIVLDRLDFIGAAKRFVEVDDFFDLIQRVVYPAESHGKLGGKAAGLFLAQKVLARATQHAELFANVKIPRTWYVASDAILDFIQINQLKEVYNRKYMEIDRVRQDYPFLIQLFKNSQFPVEVTRGLAPVLDEFAGRPLIVRSSSVLEDQSGASFSGKYKSLFLANQGTKRERTEALQDAIVEIWASVFGPDPIEYRAERGMLDFREEMGILIQEVVGTRVGRYYLPAFAGVAFGNNEIRWSPRIQREDGLVRMVPGLGTRAVDRVADDYPVLLSPGQPGLRANVTPDEVMRYSPKKVDVIDLETNSFETIDLQALLRAHGNEYPLVQQMVSIVDGDRLREPMGLEPDFERDDVVVTFENMIGRTPFPQQIRAALDTLREGLGVPVDIEFASDGTDLYILQCRIQSHSETRTPPIIPPNLPDKDVLFTAHRQVANGRVSDIRYIVYVDPAAYGRLATRKELIQVGEAVGRVNALLPKRQFVLMGPGRWGSRGDIKLGVSVTYSDINNTAMLIEVARQKENYVPELSFGTHFFQDLVEADILYLPLYPDEQGVVFREEFFTRATNLLPELLPAYAHLEAALTVIDVAAERKGQLLQVLMSGDADKAVGLLAGAGQKRTRT
ncbi:MAG: PEP/pyruvate-binding domain-containing protein [Gemmatimonadota bacterium]|nr:PEP/pyruvate-binding domain-containing protein [Gemmatimonadota bacterium]